MAIKKQINKEDLGHLNYILDIASQPIEEWDGFHKPLSELYSDNASKFQVFFSFLALAIIALRYMVYRDKCINAMDNLIQKMLQKRCWGYWSKVNKGAPDPVAEGNAMYSGPLLIMIGIFEKISGNLKYDNDFYFNLNDKVQFIYNHHTLAEKIHAQMVKNSYHGLACQEGMVFVPCTNFGAVGLKLYDKIHNTDYSSIIKSWLKFVEDNFVIKKESFFAGGVFYQLFYSNKGKMSDISMNSVDAAGLALLSPLDHSLAKKFYQKYIKRAVYILGNTVKVKRELLARMLGILLPGVLEYSTAVAGAYLVAREMGDEETASKLKKYINSKFSATWRGDKLFYKSVKSPLQFTSFVTMIDGWKENYFSEIINS